MVSLPHINGNLNKWIGLLVFLAGVVVGAMAIGAWKHGVDSDRAATSRALTELAEAQKVLTDIQALQGTRQSEISEAQTAQTKDIGDLKVSMVQLKRSVDMLNYIITTKVVTKDFIGGLRADSDRQHERMENRIRALERRR